MQSDIEIANGKITGESKYVTGYVGFSSNVSEQSGNYLALKATAVDGATIVFNGLRDVTLDADGEIVIRLRSGVNKLKFTATKGDVTEFIEYSIEDLEKGSEQ